jgi:hypothetical protein
MSIYNLPETVTKFANFGVVGDKIEALLNDKNLFHNMLQFVLDTKYPAIPARKTQIILDYKTNNVSQEPERMLDDEKLSTDKNYVNKFSKDYLSYYMNSIVSEESELRMTTYDLDVLDRYYESKKDKRYGFLPLTVHARDTPNSNQHYLLIILDYKTDKFYLFDPRNTNDYLFRSALLPNDALEQLMIGLTQYNPFKNLSYVPMAEWLGNQLQVVVHRNKWDSIYSLAWCLFVASWLEGSSDITPESLMIDLNNSDIELDKQNFIHNFAQSVLYNYRDSLNNDNKVRPYKLVKVEDDEDSEDEAEVESVEVPAVPAQFRAVEVSSQSSISNCIIA